MFTKKILCVGTNGVITDQMTVQLAENNTTQANGLITDENFIPNEYGFYHTTVIDVPIGGIVFLAKYFDSVVMLDQPIDQWSHWKLLLTTYRLMQHLDKAGYNTQYRDNANIQQYLEFDEFLDKNKSFCIYPWIEKIEHNGKMNPCARSDYVITTLDKLGKWDSDPEYQKIRNAMLEGKRLPEMCNACYKYERLGIESYRIFETREWISKLGINSLDDLKKITHPHYYEVRLSNNCNLACRGCPPSYSNKIEREFKKFNIVYPGKPKWEYSSLDIIDMDTLAPDVRVYLTGGEPTTMPEVYQFMEECIRRGKTDFDFTIGTNAAKINSRFFELASHFSSMNFSVSIDGFGKVNDYWRWGSNWESIISNTKKLAKQGHTISINCVPGIYNVTSLHLLFEFLDRELPFANLYLQINCNGCQSAYNHPNAAMAIDSLKKCQATKIYYADGKSATSTIDSLLEHYSKNPQCDLALLREFFDFNDKLDNARNVKLGDYIPELEECRKLLGP